MNRKLLTVMFYAGLIQPAMSMDLMDAYNSALTNDPAFRSAQMERDAGAANKAIGLSAMLPKVTASYTNSRNRTSNVSGSNIPEGSFTSNYSVLQVTQPLFSLDAWARWRQGVAQAEFSDSKFLYNSQDLLVRVLQAYTDTLFAYDQMSFQKAERDALLEQSKLGQKFFEKGEGSKTDALESLAAYEVSEAKLAEANDLFENAKQKLEAITGAPIKDYSELKPLTYTFKFLPVNPQKYENWKDAALGKNPEIKAAENQIEIAKQEHTKNMAGHAPVLNLIGATSHQQSNTLNTIGTKANQDYVGIQLNIPIFSGGEVNARTTQAYSAYQKSKADLDATKDKVLVELRKQYDSVQTGAIKIQALGRSLESSSLLVESMKNSIRRGERVNVDLLMAQKNLYNVRKDLAQAKYNYLLSYLKLYQQAGMLQPENFQEVAAYFK